MEIQRDQNADNLYFSQRKYLKKVFGCFGIQDYKLMSTPLITHFKLSLALWPENKKEKVHMLDVLYASEVWSIMYVIVYTHLDISYVINIISRFIGIIVKLDSRPWNGYFLILEVL
jgi:hypothetical protein